MKNYKNEREKIGSIVGDDFLFDSLATAVFGIKQLWKKTPDHDKPPFLASYDDMQVIIFKGTKKSAEDIMDYLVMNNEKENKNDEN